MVWSQQLHVHVLSILVGMCDQIIAVGVMEKFPYHLHSVLCYLCGVSLHLHAVSQPIWVGFVWSFCSVYNPFSVCLIICYRNSTTLP